MHVLDIIASVTDYMHIDLRADLSSAGSLQIDRYVRSTSSVPCRAPDDESFATTSAANDDVGRPAHGGSDCACCSATACRGTADQRHIIDDCAGTSIQRTRCEVGRWACCWACTSAGCLTRHMLRARFAPVPCATYSTGCCRPLKAKSHNQERSQSTLEIWCRF